MAASASLGASEFRSCMVPAYSSASLDAVSLGTLGDPDWRFGGREGDRSAAGGWRIPESPDGDLREAAELELGRAGASLGFSADGDCWSDCLGSSISSGREKKGTGRRTVLEAETSANGWAELVAAWRSLPPSSRKWPLGNLDCRNSAWPRDLKQRGDPRSLSRFGRLLEGKGLVPSSLGLFLDIVLKLGRSCPPYIVRTAPISTTPPPLCCYSCYFVLGSLFMN